MPRKKTGKEGTEISTADHEEHIRLADIVKGVHSELRNKFKTNACDLDQIWQQHCENESVLSEYAVAMHKLATQHWTKNPETRIDWCRQVIHEYFQGDGLKKVLEKEERKKKFQQAAKEGGDITTREATVEHNSLCVPFEGKILLLDVGSCFNPFSEFDEFSVVGIDISPAVESVYKCDFLNLHISDSATRTDRDISTFLTSLSSPIECLPANSFHVIVFSLLLEYLPAPYQRWKCCQNAHKLLRINGVLIIVTPDSHHQQRNAPLMKNWKTAMESLGFQRWRYVKLEHLHCMVFRKTEHSSELDEPEKYVEMLKIHQDLHEEASKSSGTLRSFSDDMVHHEEEDPSLREKFLHELPLIGASGDDFT